MTPRERVLRAIAHQPTDRAPADYGAHQDVTDRLIEKLGVADYEELLQALHVDLRRVVLDYSQPDTGPDSDGYWRTFWGTRYRRDEEGRPYDWIPPFHEGTTLEDVLAHPWPDPDALDYSQVLPQCEKYYGQYATFGAPWSPFFHEVGWLIGQENFFI